ncbi:MAG TPA: hypothetical protein VJK29_09375 [Terriglobales bacterium]|nr:hypothetical protein [Terriglobales bacterium]
MVKFQVWAQPWWVNLLVLVPLIVWFLWRREGLRLSWRQLTILAGFAAAFGFSEAAVVVYLRAAAGLLPGYAGTLADVQRAAAISLPAQSTSPLPQSLLTVEVFREAATLVMLVSVALLSGPRPRERWASFLWVFAIWDIAYYAGLWATVRWPSSLKDLDVLFLMPVPWISQVWFPLLVSALTLLAVALARTETADAKAK